MKKTTKAYLQFILIFVLAITGIVSIFEIPSLVPLACLESGVLLGWVFGKSSARRAERTSHE
jgi:hypothetical protein